jgi:hypothetical protein
MTAQGEHNGGDAALGDAVSPGGTRLPICLTWSSRRMAERAAALWQRQSLAVESGVFVRGEFS